MLKNIVNIHYLTFGFMNWPCRTYLSKKIYKKIYLDQNHRTIGKLNPDPDKNRPALQTKISKKKAKYVLGFSFPEETRNHDDLQKFKPR
jgi:hypothetical protein